MTLGQELDISVVIITLNEQDNIGRCLQSLPAGVEVIVLDSGSNDETANIAKSHGARVYTRAFDHYAAQKNAALGYASRSWVLSLDADEVLDPVLSSVLRERFVRGAGQTGAVAFALKRRLVFMGRVMRFGKTVDFPVRVFRRGTAEFSGAIHEQLIFKGKVGRRVLPGSLLHNSYRDLSDYFLRFNRYTTSIAANHQSRGKKKSFLLHVLRPWYEFVNRYVFHLGFLDGYAGYTYALISSLYSYVKYAKYFELQAEVKHG